MLLANKLIEKISDPRNTKERYQLIVKKKKTKSIEQSQIITYEPESFENPNFIDIKPIIAENPNTSKKLSILEKINFNSNSSKYNDTRELEIF